MEFDKNKAATFAIKGLVDLATSSVKGFFSSITGWISSGKDFVSNMIGFLKDIDFKAGGVDLAKIEGSVAAGSNSALNQLSTIQEKAVGSVADATSRAAGTLTGVTLADAKPPSAEPTPKAATYGKESHPKAK
jgi:phage-related protein